MGGAYVPVVAVGGVGELDEPDVPQEEEGGLCVGVLFEEGFGEGGWGFGEEEVGDLMGIVS